MKAKLWKPDAKEASGELFFVYLACRAPYRRRQHNIRSGVGAFGEENYGGRALVVEKWLKGGGIMSYLYWTYN